MTDTRKVIGKDRLNDLREKLRKMADGWYPGHFDVPETWFDLLLIFSRYEAALPLIEAAMGAEIGHFQDYVPGTGTILIPYLSDADDEKSILMAALALRESMEKGKEEGK